MFPPGGRTPIEEEGQPGATTAMTQSRLATQIADSVVNGSTRKPMICAWADSRIKRLRPDRSAGRRLQCAARRGFEGGIKGLQYLTRRSVVAAFDVGGH
jgi:hypothetical protein